MCSLPSLPPRCEWCPAKDYQEHPCIGARWIYRLSERGRARGEPWGVLVSRRQRERAGFGLVLGAGEGLSKWGFPLEWLFLGSGIILLSDVLISLI